MQQIGFSGVDEANALGKGVIVTEYEYFGVYYRTIIGTLVKEGDKYLIQDPEVKYSEREKAFRKKHKLPEPEEPNPIKLGEYTTNIRLASP